MYTPSSSAFVKSPSRSRTGAAHESVLRARPLTSATRAEPAGHRGGGAWLGCSDAASPRVTAAADSRGCTSSTAATVRTIDGLPPPRSRRAGRELGGPWLAAFRVSRSSVNRTGMREDAHTPHTSAREDDRHQSA
eukprot:scaffold63029_cov72-Phaeocystis_antarctica.AAC.2